MSDLISRSELFNKLAIIKTDDNEYKAKVFSIIQGMDSQSATKWHDLRKNPDDLPPTEHEVDIVYIGCMDKYCYARAVYEDGSVRTEDSIFWLEDNEWCDYCEETDAYIIPVGWIESAKFLENSGLVDRPVVAWKEIEPFEELIAREEET